MQHCTCFDGASFASVDKVSDAKVREQARRKQDTTMHRAQCQPSQPTTLSQHYYAFYRTSMRRVETINSQYLNTPVNSSIRKYVLALQRAEQSARQAGSRCFPNAPALSVSPLATPPPPSIDNQQPATNNHHTQTLQALSKTTHIVSPNAWTALHARAISANLSILT